MNELSEKELKKLVNKDKDIFIKVYKIYAPRLVAFTFYYVKNIEDAKDIVEDAFGNFYKYLNSYDKNKSNLFTYLCSICKNLSMSYLKKESNIPLSEYDDRVHGVDNKPTYMLYDLKKIMSEEEYMIMYLKYIDDNTIKEISKKMNISERTIYRKLNDIEAIVKKYVEDNIYG